MESVIVMRDDGFDSFLLLLLAIPCIIFKLPCVFEHFKYSVPTFPLRIFEARSRGSVTNIFFPCVRFPFLS